MKDIKIISHKNRKAISFFLFDAVIASLVFFMAVAIIIASINREPEIETPKLYAENLMNYYFETKVSDIENQYVNNLLISKEIQNPSRTLIEQILIFSYQEKDEIATNFTREISENKFPSGFGLDVSIINSTGIKMIYEKSSTRSEITSKINLKRIVITKSGETIIGPVKLSINVWY